jgi:hypothetical protein
VVLESAKAALFCLVLMCGASAARAQSSDCDPKKCAAAQRAECDAQKCAPAGKAGCDPKKCAAAQRAECDAQKCVPARNADCDPKKCAAADDESNDMWLDRSHQELYDLVWRSAMHVDRMFGSEAGEDVYRKASGSIAPALLWDQFNGFQPRLRFRVDFPLPTLNDRFHAFLGRVDREEYVTERSEQSGAFQRQYGPTAEEQTLFGLVYSEPHKQGSSFDAGAGVALRFPPDPYVKGSYVYERGSSHAGILSLRQTLFYQNSEGFGVTSRADLERVFDERWLVSWTNSATISQRSQGVFAYSSLYIVRGLRHRRALAFAVGLDGSTDAPVSLHEYGVKAAYRESVYRDWLVLELRSSLTWPKVDPTQPREPSWGVGIGLEMFFGTDQFLARPATF